VVDLRRIAGLAIVLIVLLRISIGWQFLYEGLWKVNEQKSSTPWSAEGFLKNAEGPFRDNFRSLTGDPDDLQWINYDQVNENWEAWRERFIRHYGLNEVQVASLEVLFDGSPRYYGSGKFKLDQLPPAVADKIAKDKRLGLNKIISLDPSKKVLVIDGRRHILPNEVAALESAAPVEKNEFGVIIGGAEENKKFHAALKEVAERQSKLGYREKLRAMLVGNEERVGAVREDQKGTIDYKLVGENEKYQKQLAEYQKMLGAANLDFERRHVDFYKRRLQEMRAGLVGPIKALDTAMKDAATKVLTTQQLALGPVPEAQTQMSQVNTLTIWMLLVLGVMLIAGLGTRIAAIAGAGMLLSFYLAYPPWPGVEPAAPGPEHSLFVNKNLIEVIALLAIAAMPTGTWFGVDGIFRAIFRRREKVVAAGTRAVDVPAREPQIGETRAETKKTTTSATT
jgi:uncharacterized membrane protein YphA (DoxX/SURF4 family)